MLIDCGALPAYRGYYSALEEILAVCSPQGQDPWGPSLVEGAGPVAGPGGSWPDPGPDPGPDPTLTHLLSVCQLALVPFPFSFLPLVFFARGPGGRLIAVLTCIFLRRPEGEAPVPEASRPALVARRPTHPSS